MFRGRSEFCNERYLLSPQSPRLDCQTLTARITVAVDSRIRKLKMARSTAQANSKGGRLQSEVFQAQGSCPDPKCLCFCVSRCPDEHNCILNSSSWRISTGLRADSALWPWGWRFDPCSPILSCCHWHPDQESLRFKS